MLKAESGEMWLNLKFALGDFVKKYFYSKVYIKGFEGSAGTDMTFNN